MSLVLLLEELAAKRIELRLEGDGFRYRAPEGVLGPDLRKRIGEQKAALIAHLSGKPLVEPSVWRSPASAAQGRLWFVHQLQGPNATYNIPFGVTLHGRLDVGALRQSLEAMMRRHQLLRSAFLFSEDALLIEIHRELLLPWEELDLATLAAAERAGRLAEFADTWGRHHFDLSKAPLLRAALVRLAEDEHVLLINVHHIVADGWSLAIIQQELMAGYAAARHGAPPELRPLAWQYTDYVAWQRQLAEQGAMDAALAYWREKLRGAPKCTTLPADFPRPEVQAFTGGSVTWDLDPAVVDRLRAKAREWGVSLNHVTVAATVVLLWRLTGARDLVIGMPLANRTRRELEPLVGMFVNVVPLRIGLRAGARIEDLVTEIKYASTEAMEHCHLPFERLVEEIAPERNLAMSPLFQVVYNFLPPMETPMSFGGLQAAPAALFEAGGVSKYDCSFYLDEHRGGVAGRIEYADRLYRPETARRWAKGLARICHRLAEGIVVPEALVAGDDGEVAESASRVDAAETSKIETVWVGPAVPIATESPWARFAAVVQGSPQAIAVEEDGKGTTFGELARRAGIVAARLARDGVGKGARVGLILPRGADYLAAMLGVVHRGAVFVPIDRSQPAERIARLGSRARLAAVVGLAGDAAAMAAAPVAIAIDGEMWNEPTVALPPVPCGPDDPLYMIFTSGSTGQPKAVVLAWRGLANLVQWLDRSQGIAGGDRVSQIASIGFDASLFEIWPALLRGSTVVIVPDDLRLDPEALRDWLVTNRITVHFSPTPLAEGLLALAWPAITPLRILNTGGQALRRRPRPGMPFRVLNNYGPTEATVAVTCGEVAPESPGCGLPSLGQPIDNTVLAIVDAAGHRVAVGASGELAVAGPGVGLGYFEEPEATARGFVSLPDDPSRRWYRTGDQVRCRPNGEFEFLGRTDGQIKLRGHRIEIGEIECELLRAPGVRQAAVRVEHDELVAYVEPEDPAPLPQALRRHLAGILPAYMVPQRFTVVERLPRSTSGKIDLGAVPLCAAPVALPPAAPSAMGSTVAGVTRAWTSVLRGTPEPNENFFDAGGHSLLLVRLREAIGRETGRDISVLDLFRQPTIARQAALLDGTVSPANLPLAASAAASAVHDIAIIGLAGRFPEADNVEEFWKNLCDGRDCITHFGRDELLAAGVPPQLVDAPDYVAANGVLRDIDRFDAEFFGIPPAEAEVLDPQQRLLLEEAWHAFEDAAYDPARIEGRVGVFVGSSLNGYLIEHVLPNRRVLESFGGFAVTIHNDKDFAATRISYKLGLSGPSLSVNTACSTSLVAVHQAVTALRDGQCELALAGGSCVRTRQIDGYRYENGGVLSRDGRCRAFDAAATGMVGGSGVALVLLKPLAAAIADRDHVYAVIKGTAVNNDGGDKVGFTAPSVHGQARVVRDALQRAGVTPDTVAYVEAHGTATQLGDTIEVAALAQVYAPDGRRAEPLRLGSVKTNVGHLDAAAGAAGLIKTALCLRERTWVPSLHFETPNPQIEWPGRSFVVCTRTEQWHRDGRPVRAAISSLGIGGTNAHAILEEPPESEPMRPDAGDEPSLLLFSGQTEAALRANVATVSDWIGRHATVHLPDVAHTLQAGRRHWPKRMALCVAQAGESIPAESELPALVSPAARVAFLFTGMGTHRPGAVSALYRKSAVFRAVVDECATCLEPELGLDLRSALLAHPNDAAAAAVLDAHRTGQPALFIVDYALARFWMDLGLVPTVLVGHSLGEWVAACLAGVFELPDALRLVALRGRLMGAQEKGAMLAVNLAPAEVVARLPAGLDVAIVNAVDQVVVSGPAAKVDAFAAELEAGQIRVKRLAVTIAAHSALMEPAIAPLRAAIAAVPRQPANPQFRLLSNTTGKWVDPARLQDPDYWTEHLRRCVLFADNVGHLWRQPGLALVECGPSHTLCNIAQRDARRCDDRAIVASSDAADDPELEWRRILTSAGTLWSAGLPIDLGRLFALQPAGRRIPLPGYVFQRKRFWLDAAASPEPMAAARAEPVADADENPRPLVVGSPAERRVMAVMHELLGPVHLAPNSDFFLAGGDSLLAVRLATRLGDVFGVQPDRGEVIKARTPAEIARLVAGRNGSKHGGRNGGGNGRHEDGPDGCVVRLTRGEDHLAPIVFVHAVGGGAFIYRELLQSLASPHPAYGLQAVGLWDDAEPIKGLQAQADHYYRNLIRAGIRRPAMIAGSSYGGLVAYELDQRYRRDGHAAPVVALFDSPGPGHMPARLETEAEVCAYLVGNDTRNRDFATNLAAMRALDHSARLARVGEQLRRTHLPQASAEDVKRLIHVFQQNLANMWGWRPEAHDTRLVFFKAKEQAAQVAIGPELAWVPLAPLGIEILPVPGDHASMLSPPQVQHIATELGRRLSAASAGAARAQLVPISL